MSPWWSWTLAAGSLLGSELIARRHRSGWWVQLTGQAGWAAYGLMAGQPGFIASAAIFAAQNMLAIRRWGRTPATPEET